MSERNAALLAWYDANKRDFPWRGTVDPYPTLIAEVMSQQTQISRVVERYGRFLDRFPTVEDLASASLADVLDEWSGLGYNRRARSLHQCAKAIVQSGWPHDAQGLMALPGIGPYTAAALASVCFGEPLPAVDTNLRRILSRWNGSPLTDAEARGWGEPLIDRERPGDWNQALMDLAGALCSPRDPQCEACPVERWCSDAEVYVAPPSQGPFEGSSREARGAVIRILRDGPSSVADMAERSGLAPDRLHSALADLVSEGLVESVGADFKLPDRSVSSPT